MAVRVSHSIKDCSCSKCAIYKKEEDYKAMNETVERLTKKIKELEKTTDSRVYIG